jgi:archaellum component FlaC
MLKAKEEAASQLEAEKKRTAEVLALLNTGSKQRQSFSQDLAKLTTDYETIESLAQNVAEQLISVTLIKHEKIESVSRLTTKLEAMRQKYEQEKKGREWLGERYSERHQAYLIAQLQEHVKKLEGEKADHALASAHAKEKASERLKEKEREWKGALDVEKDAKEAAEAARLRQSRRGIVRQVRRKKPRKVSKHQKQLEERLSHLESYCRRSETLRWKGKKGPWEGRMPLKQLGRRCERSSSLLLRMRG